MTFSRLLAFHLLLGLLPRTNDYFNVLLTHIGLCKVAILARTRLDAKWSFSRFLTRLGITGWITSFLGLHFL